MSVNKNTLSTEIQPAISDSVPSDNHDKSAPPEVQPTAEHETQATHIPDSDANKPSTTPPPEVQSTTAARGTPVTQVPDSNANKHATTISGQSPQPEVQPTTHETPATQIPDSDANKQAATISTQSPPPEFQPTTTVHETPATQSSQPEVQPTATDKTPVTQIPDSDANKQAATISGQSQPLEDQPTSTAHETPATKSSPPEVQPTVADKTPVTQIPDSDTNKQAATISGQSPPPEVQPTTTAHETPATQSSPPEVQPTATDKTPATQISDSNANKQAATISGQSPPPEVQPASTAHETPATKSSPPEVQPTVTDKTPATQIPDSDANKHATGISTNDPANSSPPEIQPATDPQANNDNPTAAPTPDQERKHLVNLIEQELKFVDKTCPKLGKHQQHIKKEADEALNLFEKLRDQPCELKELKDLKKIVTKLKLQIPSKYRTYDETDQQKNQQSDGSAGTRGTIPAKLLKKMPHFHNKQFHEGPFCKIIQQRYNDLTLELKLCLLCFSVFPENAFISRRLMVYWWIGEGFIPPEDEIEGGKTTEDIANGYFNELIHKNFIEPVSKRPGCNVAVCKMHPLVRAALVTIAEYVKFFDFDEYGKPKDFGKFDEIETPDEMPDIYPLGDPREFFDFFNEKREPTPETETIVFFDLNGNPTPFADISQNPNLTTPMDRDGNLIQSKKYYFYRKKKITTRSHCVCLMGSGLSKGLDWETLHMLFNVKDDILEFKPEWFSRMRNVNIVFLGRWQSSATHHIEVEEFNFDEILTNMTHLKFFSLQGVSRISELPKSISNLENLLILDLRACHNLEIIPKTIGSLKHLTHLDMSECYLLEHMPKELSLLESLQVIKGFVVVDAPSRHTCTLRDLSRLQNLKKLSMYTHMKKFPQEHHFDALQKFETLRKLTIAWGGHESKTQNGKSKNTPNQVNFTSKVMRLVSNKQWVRGKMRRMNAFNDSTLGSRLQKLDLKCFPESVTPVWLTPSRLKGLEKLYIRGGLFSDLGQFQDEFDWETGLVATKETWNVSVLRLKYLDELEMDWRELNGLFPKLTSLEKVKCPKLTLFPCDESGVWTKKTATTTTTGS